MIGRATGERGQVTLLVLGLSLVVFAIAGLTIDGTRAFLYRRTLQNSADAAALAGAAELDRAVLYGSGGERAVIDPASARRVSSAWLAGRALPVESALRIEPEGVVVELRGEVVTTFLGLVGIDVVPVAVTARAEPVSGNP